MFWNCYSNGYICYRVEIILICILLFLFRAVLLIFLPEHYKSLNLLNYGSNGGGYLPITH